MTYSLSNTPNHILGNIYHFADSKTKRTLSKLDKRTYALVMNITKWIRVFPPDGWVNRGYSPDILVEEISRYPNLEKITFGSDKKCPALVEFQMREAHFLAALITHLNCRSIKNVAFRAISNDRQLGAPGEEQAKAFNQKILNFLCHEGLEKIRVEANNRGSISIQNEMQTSLQKSPHLKSFVFDGFRSPLPVSLSFANHSQLSKVKLLHWRGSAATVGSLRECKQLEELVIECEEQSASTAIAGIVKEADSWNLKRLELIGVSPQNDAELNAMTQRFPHLECLNIDLYNVSDNGIEQIGINCPKLKILKFSNKNLTDIGLTKLVQRLPLLEVLCIKGHYEISDVGVVAIALNCPQLRVIQIHFLKSMGKSAFDALAKYCPNLKAINFGYGGISLEGLPRLVPRLRYVQLYNVCSDVLAIERDFYGRYPHLNKFPIQPSLKKLSRMTL